MDVIIAILRFIGLLSIPIVHIVWIVALVKYDPKNASCDFTGCDTCPVPPCEGAPRFTDKNNNNESILDKSMHCYSVFVLFLWS